MATPADQGFREAKRQTCDDRRRKAIRDRDGTLEYIAQTRLDIPTLSRRGRDCLDFHDLGVGGLRDALEAAYAAGRNSVR